MTSPPRAALRRERRLDRVRSVPSRDHRHQPARDEAEADRHHDDREGRLARIGLITARSSAKPNSHRQQRRRHRGPVRQTERAVRSGEKAPSIISSPGEVHRLGRL